MMDRPKKLEQVVKGMIAVTDLPITAKIRTGIYEDKLIAHKLVPKLRDWGVALTTVSYDRAADFSFLGLIFCFHSSSCFRFMVEHENNATHDWLTGNTSTKWCLLEAPCQCLVS